MIAEAIEAIREEATARGWYGGRSLPDDERARLLSELRARDIADAKHALLQQGETEFFAWLERKLAHHVPYRTLSDAALAAMVKIDALGSDGPGT